MTSLTRALSVSLCIYEFILTNVIEIECTGWAISYELITLHNMVCMFDEVGQRHTCERAKLRYVVLGGSFRFFGQAFIENSIQ